MDYSYNKVERKGGQLCSIQTMVMAMGQAMALGQAAEQAVEVTAAVAAML
jgi:hypothetical protein